MSTNKETKKSESCCSSECHCCCSKDQIASFLRHLASFFDKKD